MIFSPPPLTLATARFGACLQPAQSECPVLYHAGSQCVVGFAGDQRCASLAAQWRTTHSPDIAPQHARHRQRAARCSCASALTVTVRVCTTLKVDNFDNHMHHEHLRKARGGFGLSHSPPTPELDLSHLSPLSPPFCLLLVWNQV